MTRRWAAEVAPHETLDEVYLVKRKTSAVSPSNGRAYLTLILMDRTGQLDTRVWDRAEQVEARFAENDYVRVQGKTVLYQGRLQVHAAQVERVDETALDLTQFLPCSTSSPEELWRCTHEVLDSVRDPHLLRLLDRVLDDSTFRDAMTRAPAGKTIHHARLGGLLEHNLATMRLVFEIGTVYEEIYPGLVDRDLLVTAAFLHDTGKPQEISSDARFEYTDAGRLLGHVVLGYELVSRHLEALPDFPEDLALHLLHLLLTHHGELGYGAPKRPKTVEAWILHFADLLDSRVAHTAELVTHLAPGQWTPYQPLHDRYFWRGHHHHLPPDQSPTGSGEGGDGAGDEIRDGGPGADPRVGAAQEPKNPLR